MPIYEWKCRNCGKEIEVTRSMVDRDLAPEEPCPQCASYSDWNRILSTATFNLVGGDWASTGYGTRTSKGKK